MALAFLRVSVKSTFHPRPLVAVTSSSFTSTKPTTRRTPLSRAISSASSGTDRNMAESVDSTGKTSTSHEHPHQQKAKEQHMDGPNEWKTRPPYRIGDETDGFKARWNASCHCGQVQYQLSRETALDSKLCHCTTCQKQHAAPFQWAAIFHKTDIQFKQGHHDLEWYDPSTKSVEHKLPCKVRCAHCHSPIMDEGRNMILLFPSLVNFPSKEDREHFKPRCHMFYGQRVMDIPDGLPKWTGLDKSSELIEDSPPELVRDFERKRAEEKQKKVDAGES